MMPRIAFFLSLWLVLATAQAQFLTPTEVDALLKSVPPPPVDTTPAGQADLEVLLQVQADRTPAQIERARRVDTQSPFSFGRPVLGEWFHSEDLPRTAAIFAQINQEAGHIIDTSKAQWNRPRPYQRSPEIAIVVGRPGNASYPSGHSAGAAVWAAILTAAFPEDAVGFQKQVHETMWGRMIGGVHFPSDTTAGEALGDAIGRAMLANPEMQKAIQTIREETAPFLLKKAA